MHNRRDFAPDTSEIGAFWNEERWFYVENFRAAQAWARGEGRSPLQDPRVLGLEPMICRPGGEWQRGTTAPVAKELRIACKVRIDAPTVQNWSATVLHPQLTSPDGNTWSEDLHVFTVYQDDGTDPTFVFEIAEDFQLKPGTWTIRVQNEEAQKPVGEVKFQLTR